MATINLNNPREFTNENVARMLGSVPDTQHWQLRVKKDGTAYLSEVVGNQETEDIAFRLETWCAGNSYVGFQAEHDQEWVSQVYETLRQNWPTPKSEYIDW